MDEPRAQRTLVKSPPELWAEVSDLDALARHLGEFGEIRITRLEPETTVAWEGDRVRGTVKLEPAGWGTRVTLTARPQDGGEAADGLAAAPEPVAPPPSDPEPSALTVTEPSHTEGSDPFGRVVEGSGEEERAPRRARFWARVAAWFRGEPARKAAAETGAAAVADAGRGPAAEPGAVAPEHEPVEEPVPAPPAATTPAPLDDDRTVAILTEVLDDLGAAHHRPFSRLG